MKTLFCPGVRHYLFVMGLALFFLLFFGNAPKQARACTAPPGGVTSYTLADRVKAAQVVLEGTVTSVTNSGQTALIAVKQYFKGSGPATVTINGFGPSAACLVEVKAGDNLIFYASGDPKATTLSAFYMSIGDATSPANPQTIEEIGRAAGFITPTLNGGVGQDSATTGQATAPSNQTITNPQDDMSKRLGLVIVGLVAGISVVVGTIVWRRGSSRLKQNKSDKREKIKR
jgi:hypothetical protein